MMTYNLENSLKQQGELKSRNHEKEPLDIPPSPLFSALEETRNMMLYRKERDRPTSKFEPSREGKELIGDEINKDQTTITT